MLDIDEEMKKFTEGFSYKPKEYPYNCFREILKEMNGTVTIVADNPKDQEIAKQLSNIVNHYLKEEIENGGRS